MNFTIRNDLPGDEDKMYSAYENEIVSPKEESRWK